MIIILNDKQVVRVESVRCKLETYGVKIKYGRMSHILPYSQIYSIFEGRDEVEENEYYKMIKYKNSVKPLKQIMNLSTQDLLKGLYVETPRRMPDNILIG